MQQTSSKGEIIVQTFKPRRTVFFIMTSKTKDIFKLPLPLPSSYITPAPFPTPSSPGLNCNFYFLDQEFQGHLYDSKAL